MNAPTKPFEATRSDRETRNFMVELIRMVFSTQIDKHLSFDSFGDAHNIKSCRSDRWPMVDEIHLQSVSEIPYKTPEEISKSHS